MPNSAFNKFLVLVFAYIGIIFLLFGLARIYRTRYRPVAATCKICHCNQISCSKDCGDELMCNMQCSAECARRKQ